LRSRPRRVRENEMAIADSSFDVLARVARHLPYELRWRMFYIYRRLQMAAWPGVTASHMASVSSAYSVAMNLSAESAAVKQWLRAYRRHVWGYSPAHISAIAIRFQPKLAASRVRIVGPRPASNFPCVVAVSRTSMSFMIPWFLTELGNNVTFVGVPETLTSVLLRSAQEDKEFIRGLEIVLADARCLARCKRDLLGGRTVVMLPEFGGTPRMSVPFLRTTRRVPHAAALLAMIGKVPLQPACAVFESPSRLRVEFGAPLLPGDYRSTFDLNTALFRVLDAWVRQYPEQWTGWQKVAAELGLNRS